MISEYAGWQISDDKQREIEAAIARKQLMQAAQATGGQPAWVRLQVHRLGVGMERFGARLQMQVEQCQDAMVEEPRVGASI